MLDKSVTSSSRVRGTNTPRTKYCGRRLSHQCLPRMLTISHVVSPVCVCHHPNLSPSHLSPPLLRTFQASLCRVGMMWCFTMSCGSRCLTPSCSSRWLTWERETLSSEARNAGCSMLRSHMSASRGRSVNRRTGHSVNSCTNSSECLYVCVHV